LPTGNRGQTSAPVDIFRTRDGWILVQVIGDPLFRRWAKLMGEDHWLNDPRFKDDISRGDNGAVVSERMGRWCAQYTTAEALEILGKAKLPAGPVLKPQQTLDDPHIQAMGFFQPTDFPGMARPAPIAKAPVWLSQTPGAIRHRAPVLGEHTEEILTELGYDRDAIRTLREKGVV
jgi:crotonobetainyl-CoA:carnitine CoA-transferase CaiB-like acyl-CoA transferase